MYGGFRPGTERGPRRPILTAESIAASFLTTHGDQALPKLVRLTAGEYGPVLTSHRVRQHGAVRILIHRAIQRAEAVRAVARVAPDRQVVWAPREDRYTPGYWTGD